jgi:hypothetical protein
MQMSFKAFCRFPLLSCAAFLLVVLPPLHALAETPQAEDSLTIVVDEARLVRMPDRVATLIVGNPLIADVSIQSAGLMVLTGKGYGQTNLIALDRSGNKLLEKSLLVKAPAETVVVYKGILRETYSCAPVCQPRNTLGDGPAFFETTLNQIVTRNNQASAIK